MSDGLLVMTCVLFVLAVFIIIWMSVEGYNPVTEWRKHRRKKEERKLPLYERLALAEEREAEKHLDWGNTGQARQHFREAQKIRKQAEEYILRGEYPTL